MSHTAELPEAQPTPPQPPTMTVGSFIPEAAAATFSTRVNGALQMFQQALAAGTAPDLAVTVFAGGVSYSANLLAAAVIDQYLAHSATARQFGAKLALAVPVVKEPPKEEPKKEEAPSSPNPPADPPADPPA